MLISLVIKNKLSLRYHACYRNVTITLNKIKNNNINNLIIYLISKNKKNNKKKNEKGISIVTLRYSARYRYDIFFSNF
jgi:hypothetical protein